MTSGQSQTQPCLHHGASLTLSEGNNYDNNFVSLAHDCLDSGLAPPYHSRKFAAQLLEFNMFLVDAFLQIFDFVRALLSSGQIPQDNAEAGIYNFLAFFLNLFSFVGF